MLRLRASTLLAVDIGLDALKTSVNRKTPGDDGRDGEGRRCAAAARLRRAAGGGAARPAAAARVHRGERGQQAAAWHSHRDARHAQCQRAAGAGGLLGCVARLLRFPPPQPGHMQATRASCGVAALSHRAAGTRTRGHCQVIRGFRRCPFGFHMHISDPVRPQALDLLRLLLDPDMMEGPVEKNTFMDLFYDHHMSRVLELVTAGGAANEAGPQPYARCT